ncbi:hypothetical protein SAMN05216388_1005168 [Halorientalis persicus]|jgi:hypothetical protein|uniref:Hsp20/alpha crystallin family protein n=1 Tax=Halorientalis persicus TaxID=1367881 RepID=A0A1H8JT53_9EURY|nr:hypothetical protein [Halorientalis persicus]SEN83731.1 hypothetical protein SAMN05216388_1005168 [Halorientalis persicus]
MTGQEQFRAEEGPVGRREYDDGAVVFVADVGVGRDTSVDLVGDTAIVVADGEQYEFDVENGEDAQAFMKNGVLTVEVNA